MEELVAFEMAARDLVGVALRSLDRLPISLPQFRLLTVLDERGRSTSTECARALGVAGSSVTRLADRLHASGHLARGTNEANRSIVMLELTDRGRDLVAAATAARRRELSRALDDVDPADRAVCARVLQALHEHFGDQHTGPHHPMPV